MDTSYQAFACFYRLAIETNAGNVDLPLTESLKMMLWILDKYPYPVLSKGSRKNGPEQGEINHAGATVLRLFLDFGDDIPEAKELFDRTARKIRLMSLSTGEKTKLLKFFRDEYVKNLPDEV